MIGIDEVGRGCWAGPMLVVAARQTSDLPSGITDSKAISKQKRSDLVDAIASNCDIGEGWVEANEIDKLGLTSATRLGVSRALASLEADPGEQIVIDGHINYCEDTFVNVETIIKADLTVPIVGAASIYAKVVRDSYMSNLPSRYSKYCFESHVGYGTAQHKRLLTEFGVSDIHRMSYKPVKLAMRGI